MIFSFFKFYYYVITKNNKKYDIATNSMKGIVVILTPILLMILYPFIVMHLISEVFAYSAYMLIPVVLGNLMFVSRVADEGYKIKIEEKRKVLEEHHRILLENIERLRRMRGEREYRERTTKLQRQKDKNRTNAIKLMKINDDPTVEEVKIAYRKLSKIHHPDAPRGSHENFIRLNKAYEYLINNM